MTAAINFTATGVDFAIEASVDTPFDDASYIKFKNAVDTSTHRAGYGVGVGRVGSVAPAATGDVQVTGGLFKWWDGAAIETAVGLTSTQSVTGVKTLTTPKVVTSITPSADDGATLGTTALQFADVFLATGGVINWNSGDVTLTHAANSLAVAGGILTSASSVFIGDTANATVTLGLTINQGAAADEIVSLKSSDISHGMTGLTEDDTFGSLGKYSSSLGGLAVRGWSESTIGVMTEGHVTTVTTTKATTSVGAVCVIGFLKNGTGRTSLGANANIMTVADQSLTRFILDADGDSHQDVGTAWTNYDAYDDLALLDATSALLARDPGGLRKSFTDGFLAEHKEILAEQRIVTFNDDGHHFINWSRFQMLHMGATRYLGDRVAALVATVEAQAVELGGLRARLALTDHAA